MLATAIRRENNKIMKNWIKLNCQQIVRMRMGNLFYFSKLIYICWSFYIRPFTELVSHSGSQFGLLGPDCSLMSSTFFIIPISSARNNHVCVACNEFWPVRSVQFIIYRFLSSSILVAELMAAATAAQSGLWNGASDNDSAMIIKRK